MSVVNRERLAQSDCQSPAFESDERTLTAPANVIANLTRLACTIWDDHLPTENRPYYKVIEMEFMHERRRLMQIADDYFNEQKYFECMLTLKKVRELVVPSFDTSSLAHIDAIIAHLQSMDTAIFDSIQTIDTHGEKIVSLLNLSSEIINEAA